MKRALIELPNSEYIMYESKSLAGLSNNPARYSTEIETTIFPFPGSPMAGTLAPKLISLCDVARLSAKDGYTWDLPLDRLIGCLKCTPLGRIGNVEVSLLSLH